MSEASPHFAAFDWDAAMIDVAAAVNFLKKKGCEKVNFITACKRCCGEVMFLHPSVCSQGEGIGFPACITGHMTTIQGGLHPWGNFIAYGGWSALRGSASRGVGHIPPTRTRKADGTHPTGMLFCLV